MDQNQNIPTRLNNPGSLKDPSTGQFRQFNSPQEGYAALLNDLETKKSGKSKTGLQPQSSLVDFAKVYAPSSDKNNPAQYAANIANHLGVAPDAQIKDLDTAKWAEAIAKNEGYKGTFSAPGGSGAQGLGQTTDVGEQKPGFVQSLVQGVAHPFLQGAASLGALMEAGNPENYQKIQREGLDFGYFGKARPVGAGFDVTKGIGENIRPLASAAGTGLEAASYIAPVGALGKTAEAIRGGRALGVAAKGAFTGAEVGGLQGAGQGLQEEKATPGSVAVSGLEGLLGGAATGGALGAAGGMLGKLGGEGKVNSIINKRSDALSEIENSNSKIRNYLDTQRGRGFDPLRDIAKTDLLVGAVDDNGVIRTKGEGGAVDAYNKAISSTEGVISNLLRKEGTTVPSNAVESAIMSSIDKAGLKGAARERAITEATQDLQGYARELGIDTKTNPVFDVPLSLIHDAKVDKYANLNYLNPESQRAGKAIAKGLKQTVEKNAKSADIKQLNKELSQHFANIGFLEKLDGTRVSGGRLGKYFASTIGAMVGSHFGPLASVIGAEIGSRIQGRTLAGRLGGKIGRLVEKPSLAMERAIRIGQGEERRLPVRSLPSQYTNELPSIGIGSKPVSRFKRGFNLPTVTESPKVFGAERLKPKEDIQLGTKPVSRFKKPQKNLPTIKF